MNLTEKRAIDRCNRIAIPIKYIRELNAKDFYIILDVKTREIRLVPVK